MLHELIINGDFFSNSDCRGAAHSNLPEGAILSEWYFQSPYLSFGDYDNSCHVERSNVRTFMSMYGSSPYVSHHHGAYDSEWILVRCDCDDQSILQTLESLESYPIIDDMDASDMELEMYDEAWYAYLDSDFSSRLRREAAKVSEELDEKAWDLDSDQLEELAKGWTLYAQIESGGSVYVNWDRMDWDQIVEDLKEI